MKELLAASLQLRCRQMRTRRGDTNTFFDLESSFILA